MITIILAHPWHGSFNKAILDTVTTKLDKDNRAYQVIDLHKDGFDPTVTEADLAVFNQGKWVDPLVGKYQKYIEKTSEIIFIFPIWWGTMPAILKGFFDKVMLYEFAYSYENGWTGLLTNINKATIITTSQAATETFKNSIENNFIPSMLQSIGISNATWLNNPETSTGTDDQRKNFLSQIEEHI